MTSLEEEANYWDTHSPVNAKGEGRVVAVVRRPTRTGILTVRLAPQELAALDTEAERKGVGKATLARMWILEHLAGR